MALIHTATLTPSKLGLLTGWLPTRTWFTGDAEIWQVGAYRFDDPAGEVGVETLLVEGGNGSVFHVPLTYRGSPRLGGEESSSALRSTRCWASAGCTTRAAIRCGRRRWRQRC